MNKNAAILMLNIRTKLTDVRASTRDPERSRHQAHLLQTRLLSHSRWRPATLEQFVLWIKSMSS